MKKNLSLITLIFFFIAFVKLSVAQQKTPTYETIEYEKISMGIQRIPFAKVKFKFFSKTPSDPLPYRQYEKWKTPKQKLLFYSSCAYMDHCEVQMGRPVGINIVNGILVNKVVDPNLTAICMIANNGTISIKNKNTDAFVAIPGKRMATLKETYYLDKILQQLTTSVGNVFQAHLMWYNNAYLNFTYNSKPAKRRALAIAADAQGKKWFIMMNTSSPVRLANFASATGNFLLSRNYTIESIVNLDTGCQNVFGCYKSDGSFVTDSHFLGDIPIQNASSILVGYE